MLRSPRTVTSALAAFGLLVGLSGCADKAVDTIEQGRSTACGADLKVVETAMETYYAGGGTSGTATVDALVSAGLLRTPSSSYTIVNGLDIVPIPGGPCDTTDGTTPAGGAASALTPEQCEADRVALQGAVDAFGAAYSVSPMDEAELVKAQLLTTEVAGYDLQGATVVPVAGTCA